MTERKKAVSIIDTAFYVNYISGVYASSAGNKRFRCC